MKVIHKFQLQPVHSQEIHLPPGYEILSVKDQSDTICLWLLIDPDIATKPVEVLILGTGEYISDSADIISRSSFVGTVIKDGMVYHVFIPQKG